MRRRNSLADGGSGDRQRRRPSRSGRTRLSGPSECPLEHERSLHYVLAEVDTIDPLAPRRRDSRRPRRRRREQRGGRSRRRSTRPPPAWSRVAGRSLPRPVLASPSRPRRAPTPVSSPRGPGTTTRAGPGPPRTPRGRSCGGRSWTAGQHDRAATERRRYHRRSRRASHVLTASVARCSWPMSQTPAFQRRMIFILCIAGSATRKTVSSTPDSRSAERSSALPGRSASRSIPPPASLFATGTRFGGGTGRGAPEPRDGIPLGARGP